jgi:SSS family solute:Na+ symporter
MSSTLLGFVLLAFVLAMFGLGYWARGRIHDAEDYLIAGRRLPLSLATATLLATWFGAGTLLTATDEVRSAGLQAAALEPIGAGLCLVAAGLFFARRLWDMQLVTLPDFYRRRFGVKAEVVASLIMVPGYFGWIAAQFVALAGILELFWGIPLGHGLWLVAAVGTGYTLLGGMWSVTATDAVQLVCLIIGLAVLALTVLAELAGTGPLMSGLGRFADAVPADRLVLIPTQNLAAFVGWLSVLAIGILGNIPGQDLAQRVFASRSAAIARTACLIAGVAYVGFGMIPVFTGLAADVLPIDLGDTATVPALVAALMSPAVGIVFIVALTSAVLSTIDSAILAPSSVVSNNLFAKLWPERSVLAMSRWATLGVALASLAIAYFGEDAYALLESAYAIGMVGLFVPLAVGLHSARGAEDAALAAMATGTLVWLLHLALGWESFAGPLIARTVALPQELAATALGWAAYELIGWREAIHARPMSGTAR